MAHRLRRALSLSYPLLHRSLHQHKPFSPIFSHLLSLTISSLSPAATIIPSSTQLTRPFTSTSTLFRKTFDPETDEIGPDTILFEGCDYNHWLITMDFPKDSNLTREEKIETYVNTAAQIFGSVEEAKKNIYALSTTTYQGFQVLCSEETSEKFKDLPGVVFVLPDSYIDPVNKEYGGDKYVNGEIFPRPPPVHYGKRDNSYRHRRENYRPPQQQQNYGPPQQQQNYGRPQQQNVWPPQQQQNYGPPQQQQNDGPSQQQQQNYVLPPPRQDHGPPLQQNYGSPPQQQNYGPPPQQQNYGPPAQQQNYVLRPRQNYGQPPQQNYESPPQQRCGNNPYSPPQPSYGPPRSGDPRSFTSPNNAYEGNFDRTEPGNHYAEGQRNFQQGNFPNHVAPEQRGFSQDAAYGSFELVPGAHRKFSSTGKN